MRILYLYRYATIGGTCTLLSNRLKYLKNYCEPHFGFLKDYGALTTFGDYEHLHIFNENNSISEYLNYCKFEAIVVIDTNEVFDAIKNSGYRGVVINEVHTTYSENLKTIMDFLPCPPFSTILTPSKYMKKRILHEFGYDGIMPVHVIYNCIDTQMFKNNYEKKNNGKKIILWVGKLDNHKNWYLFLLIAHALKTLRKDCEFWMVGGYTSPEFVKKTFTDSMNILGLSNDVKWLPKLDYSEMPELYSLAANSGGIYVSTSIDESFGMTIIEAMACRCPVMAPNVGAIPEVLAGPLSYYLYEPNNLSEVVYKIENLLENANLRTSLQHYAEKNCNDLYSTDKIGEKYFTMLTNQLSEKTSSI